MEFRKPACYCARPARAHNQISGRRLTCAGDDDDLRELAVKWMNIELSGDEIKKCLRYVYLRRLRRIAHITCAYLRHARHAHTSSGKCQVLMLGMPDKSAFENSADAIPRRARKAEAYIY